MSTLRFHKKSSNHPPKKRTLQEVKDLGDGHAAVRVGAATTNIEMLDWSKK